MLFWDNKYLDKDKAVYVLGENDINTKATVNLDICPHITIASSSGGRKNNII